MCILVIKKAGAVMPSKETLRICYTNNPDGAGFMWLRQDGQMEGYKGYFDFEEWYSAITACKFTKKDMVFFHTRIATHGGINQQNCHPFPISTKDEDLQALHFVSSIAMAHNGVIHGLPEMKHLSDTQMFIKLILADPAILNNLDSPGINYLINDHVEGSRVAVMKEGKLYLYGKFEDVNGVLYSNSSYKPYSYPKVKTKGYTKGSTGVCNFTDYDDRWDDEKYWNSVENEKAADAGFTPIEDLKQDIYDALVEGSCLDWVECMISLEDCDTLRDLEEEFCNQAYMADEREWYSIFGSIWQDVVVGRGVWS